MKKNFFSQVSEYEQLMSYEYSMYITYKAMGQEYKMLEHFNNLKYIKACLQSYLIVSSPFTQSEEDEINRIIMEEE